MDTNGALTNVCVVGGNAVSAFLSWRLQATNACDVTLVWKSGFDAVSQYGISFKSATFGNERFKPRHVVRAPEDAAGNHEGPFDYVLLCVKALPDVYDLAAVIESVVTPQHTCILVNTTHTLGVEAHLESRFPSNVVLSLVSGAEISQLGASEFEHKGSSEVWVGPANKNPSMPSTIQGDMAAALAMTLGSGQVECHVSTNIRQQQFERMIGPIAFHPTSVIFETPSHSALLEKVGVRQMVSDVFDELLVLAQAQECTFPADFKEKTMEDMVRPNEQSSIMYQDYAAKRPMEVETYLGSPIKLAQSVGVKVPRIETLYAVLHNLNIVNQQRRDAVTSPIANGHPARLSSAPPPRPMMNGTPNGRGRGRTSSMSGPPPGMRRGPPGPPNGYGRPNTGGPNGYGPPRNQSRRGSLEGNDLEGFEHLVLYDDIPESGESIHGGEVGVAGDLALRERELMLRQREMALREQEMRMRRGPPPGSRRGPPTPSIKRGGGFDDDDDDDDYFDPADAPPVPHIDPDNFDMMSVTSRRNRKAPSQSQLRKNPEFNEMPQQARRGGGFLRPSNARNRSSARIISQVPGPHDSLMDDPMMGYSSNRYGNVDRQQLGHESRTNSLTAARLDELQYGHAGPQNGQGGPFPRRMSQSPGQPYSPQMGRGNGRPSPPNGPNGYMGGPPMNGRPSPPGGVRQPVPRHPPGQGNSVAPQQVEQYAGVSALHPPKAPVNIRSLTGSASASAESGDSGASANIDSEPSAHSSQSSLGPRPQIGVR
ncbi:ApbA-domain-containing protein [Coleophoma cylindrospora]|uniref:ApbA-domain-containing protein n=1 Tax=Coleophoma cylindrospora TaxID=1849047 RepID=A0A3D8S0Z1_9HELO|nr:ApbA-domain-containing protein [Coleophoma cylindrospora]